jgi:outer membrane protein OmpA-like peptidoglycan-associated protein
VVLLPDRDGRSGAVSVTQGGKNAELERPYAAARLTSQGPQAYDSNAEQVRAQFGAALAALPAAPQQFTLYFVEGKDEFTEESRRVLDGVLGEIARRPVPDVLVVGHTDKVGSDAVNDPLSRQRAEVVRRSLMARGVAAENIVVVGRGKREPVVPTADGVAEPRNRRVEIQVR